MDKKRKHVKRMRKGKREKSKLMATLRWFTAGGAIRIALRQLSQTWKLRHYDVIMVALCNRADHYIFAL